MKALPFIETDEISTLTDQKKIELLVKAINEIIRVTNIHEKDIQKLFDQAPI